MLVVCIAASAAPENIVTAEVLKALGANGVIINIARGSVIDEDALSYAGIWVTRLIKRRSAASFR